MKSSPLAVLASALWLGLVPAGHAAANTAPSVDAAAADDVDVSALRYFARNGDTTRLKLEISRLQTLHPDWTPPADPANAPEPPDRELNAIWQLYSQDKFSEARAAIAARKAREPDWTPPTDLLTMLDLGEARRRLTNAYTLKQYATVIEAAANAPGLTSCSEVNVMWMVAESFVRTDRAKRGEDAYDYILKSCDGADIRRATMQKASDLLPYEAVHRLLSNERLTAAGAGEFDPVKDDLARRFVADANADAKLRIDKSYPERLKKLADEGGAADDLLNYAWYVWLHGRSPNAEAYFEHARQLQDSASASVGLSLTLLAKGQYAEAEGVMYGWRETSKDTTAAYLAAAANLLSQNPPATISDEVMHRIAEVVLAEHDFVTAQQFGWYARQFHQLDVAADWFATALSWSASDEPSAYGLALTRLDLGDTDAALQIRDAWATRSPRIAALGTNIDDKTAVRPGTAKPGKIAAVVPTERTNALAEAEVDRAAVSPRPAGRTSPGAKQTSGTTIARSGGDGNCTGGRMTGQSIPASDAAALRLGWCYMDLKQPGSALRAFEVVSGHGNASQREEANYGRALALLRLDLTDEAAVAATGSPMSQQRAATLQTIILANRAIAAFDGGRYREALVFLDQRATLAPEPSDLMTLRAHAYVKLRQMDAAGRIFAALAAIGNPEGTKGLNMIADGMAAR